VPTDYINIKHLFYDAEVNEKKKLNIINNGSDYHAINQDVDIMNKYSYLEERHKNLYRFLYRSF
jgi:hypothetical protein